MDKNSREYEAEIASLTVAQLQDELFALQAEISSLQEELNVLRETKKFVYRMMKRKIYHGLIERGNIK